MCKQLFKISEASDFLLDADLNQLQLDEVKNKSATEVDKMNQDAISKLEATPRNLLGQRKKELSLHEMTMIHQSIKNHPAFGFYNEAYEQPGAAIGYCFGRSTYYHLALLKNKVDKSAIRKAFVVGSMKAPDGITWQFHVTTTVRGPKNKWYAIDANQNAPLLLTDWAKIYVIDQAVYKNVRLYITDPKKFTPTTTYDQDEMGLNMTRESDWYRGYFKDMMKLFRELNK
jgi:hypothetical protein